MLQLSSFGHYHTKSAPGLEVNRQGTEKKVYQARAPFACPAAKLVSKAVGVYTPAISFDRYNFS